MNDHQASRTISPGRLIGYATLGALGAFVAYRVVSAWLRPDVPPRKENPGGRELTALLRRGPKTPARRPAMRYDAIDEVVKASFPASDPPSWTGSAATPAACLP